MKRAFVGAGLFIVLACTLAACVGDDPNPVTPSDRQPDPNVAVGREGGACTEDKKCLDGLECYRGTVCVPREDGGTSNVDGGGGDDASSDDGSAGGDDAESGSPSTCPPHSGGGATSEVKCGSGYCPGGFTPSQPCCLQATGDPTCMPGCTAKRINCDSADECPGAQCCLSLTSAITEAMACSSGVSYALLNDTHCGQCGSNDLRICRTNNDCLDLAASPTCSLVEVKNGSVKLSMGVCL